MPIWPRDPVCFNKFVDIHDIGLVGSDDFDVLITDVTDGILRTEIAELVGIPYLAKATLEEAEKCPNMSLDFLYGRNKRPIFPCVVSSEYKAHWIFFIVNTGSPATYLSTQVSVPKFYQIPGC